MNILYISRLSGASFAGPTYSVPKQIEAQSKYDNVLWFNLTSNSIEKWKKIDYYHDLIDYPDNSIHALPAPFNKPDLVVIEGFYNITLSNIQFELIKFKIPYIIIPRGELTYQAQKRKKWKKMVANFLVCKTFARRALAIQYLTKQEFIDSGYSWHNNYFIMPNGIEIPKVKKQKFSKDDIKCISIGRIEPYQKGIDIIIDACRNIKKELEAANCTIQIYGPDSENKVGYLRNKVFTNKLENIISFYDGVYGENKKELLLSSDVFIIPSRFEGHPMALIEALSYGLPCIATTGSNMRSEIEMYDAGWTADNNSKSIEKAILKMIENKTNFYKKSKNAISLSNCFLWDIIAIKTHNIFEKLLNNKGGKDA